MTSRTMQSHQPVSNLQNRPVMRNGPHCVRTALNRLLDVMTRSPDRSSRAKEGRVRNTFSSNRGEIAFYYTFKKVEGKIGRFSISHIRDGCARAAFLPCQCSSAIDFQEVIVSSEGQGMSVKSDGARKEATESLTRRCNHT